MSADTTEKESTSNTVDTLKVENDSGGAGAITTQEKTVGISALKFEEEEDIPPDFFDDFSNQDFMEGLDVVDTWDTAMQEEGELIDDPNCKEDEEGMQQKDNSKTITRINRRIRITFSKEREREQRIYRHKNYERALRCRDLREKIGRPEEKVATEAKRRDPEKTRRDILRDKDRCAKDKEEKMMKEKLKVVETGLVPPGMETEVDLADIRNKQNSLKAENQMKFESAKLVPTVSGVSSIKTDSKPKFKSRSRSLERYGFRLGKRTMRSRSRTRSRERRRLREDSSPLGRKRIRSRSRTRSPPYSSSRYDRDRKLSRDKDRKKSGDRNISRERKSPRRKTREKDRSRSRSSNISERERWLTRRRKRTRSPRTRSISPNRKRNDYKKDVSRRVKAEVKDEKPSFLEEIHRKLNETTPHPPQISIQNTMPMRPTYVSITTSQSVVPPVAVQQQQQQPVPFVPHPVSQVQYDQSVSQYDQQFFIGTCDMTTIVPQPVSAPPAAYIQPSPVPAPCPTPMSLPLPQLVRTLFPSNSLLSPNNNDYNVAQMVDGNPLFPSPIKIEKEKNALEETDKKALAKLLEDKKISLSDFLTITARPSAPRNVNLHEKVGVIARCQDAIRELGDDTKTTGRLFIKQYRKPETLDVHHTSPLRKIPIVRLNFTTVAKPGDEPSFSTTLNRLLKILDLHHNDTESEKREKFGRLHRLSKPPMPKRKTKPAAALAIVDATSPATHLMKMCQTDPYKCEVCEVRATRRFQDQAIQCEMKIVVEAATQTVAEEASPMKKSLSHMTPAEILAELGNKKKDEGIKKEDILDTIVIEDDVLDSGATLQNKERSVELDHGDKDVLEAKKFSQKSKQDEKPWSKRQNSFGERKHFDSPRGRGRGSGPPYFRNTRGVGFRPNSRKPCYNDGSDVFGPNFDDDEDYNQSFGSSQENQFNSFEDNYYNRGGPSNRPFYEPPEHVKRKFNRRFL